MEADRSVAGQEGSSMVGLALYALIAGPFCAVLAYFAGWGFIGALLAFWFGSSATVLVLAFLFYRRSTRPKAVAGTEKTAAKDMATI